MATDPKLAVVLGTRPEIIKLAPLIRACQDRSVPFIQIHTGQHYSERLDDVFFERLDLPQPEYDLAVGSQSHGAQTGAMIKNIEAVLEDEGPDTVVVQGDTNSVLAGAIAASKLPSVALAHVEAGLRSFDRTMPEEVNRRLTDHAADHLFPPTETARDNLLDENLPPDRITVTGNTIVDAVEQHVTLARQQATIHSTLDLDAPYGLLTAHRAENVDDPDRFRALLDGVVTAARERDLDVYYPVHPRAESRLDEFDIEVPSPITCIEPQDFFDFLALEDCAEIVFTDSGGVQEEACILQTPCVTLRETTERPETVDVGANRLVGVETADIVAGVDAMLSRDADWDNPFGNGTAAEQILDVLESSHD